MSQPAIESQGSEQEVVTQGAPVENSQQESTGINPAWNPLLEKLPSSLHSLVIPELQTWDKNYQDGIGKVHSEYEPWKPFQEAGVAPEQVQYGLQLLEMLESNPQQIFDSLKEFLQIEDEQPQPVVDPTQQGLEQGQESAPIDVASIPEFQQMTQMVNAMAELLVQQNSQQTEAQADQELDAEFTAAKEQFGNFDEKWVMVQMLANDNLTLPQAVQQYQEFEKGILQNANRPGPKVLSAGGQNANPGVAPSQLDDKGRRSMVANMLAAAKSQEG